MHYDLAYICAIASAMILTIDQDVITITDNYDEIASLMSQLHDLNALLLRGAGGGEAISTVK